MSTLDSAAALRIRLDAELGKRATQGRRRTLRVAKSARINLADNDYLNLANDKVLKKAVAQALKTSPISASSSPLVRGYQDVHAKLEKALCRWHGFKSGLVWNSGFAANQAVLGTLAQPSDLILADRLVHHSLIVGLLKSGAKFTRFPHNDLNALELLLKENQQPQRTIWVVTESVYSMDGDSPDLPRLAELKRQFGFIWMLDEAHALGWYGPKGQGLAAKAGVVGEVDIFIGTFGKALGGMGAYSLFHDAVLREALINLSGEFIYSTYLSPLLAIAAIAAIGRVQAESAQSSKWRKQSQRWREMLAAHGWETVAGDSPIVPVIVGTDEKVLSLGWYLAKKGFAVGTIRPPTVPEGTARLRLSLKAITPWSELESLLNAMNTWRKKTKKL